MRRHTVYPTVSCNNIKTPRQHGFLQQVPMKSTSGCVFDAAQVTQAVNIFATASGQCKSLWRGEKTPFLSAVPALILAQS